ncbi:hypothetical protein J1N51_07580 [Psychrosphaera ytuae]|uniref:Uncharacterized protein n=1 Tax=Psychrosphaera ytuae TaxID=2820710 RepID=A0A975D970_9GAMM|nr:hypothetical protein [Psychrosphaera ytuae]QTH62643.1 hypothetical protein J1N51_07580 [Psychrosphaera ytuae]
MEDLADSFFKGIARAIGWLFVDLIFNFVFYYIGWPICKLVSFGKYPKPVNYDYLHTENRQGLLCSFVGFFACLLLFIGWVNLSGTGI